MRQLRPNLFETLLIPGGFGLGKALQQFLLLQYLITQQTELVMFFQFQLQPYGGIYPLVQFEVSSYSSS